MSSLRLCATCGRSLPSSIPPSLSSLLASSASMKSLKTTVFSFIGSMDLFFHSSSHRYDRLPFGNHGNPGLRPVAQHTCLRRCHHRAIRRCIDWYIIIIGVITISISECVSVRWSFRADSSHGNGSLLASIPATSIPSLGCLGCPSLFVFFIISITYDYNSFSLSLICLLNTG